jgi:hypothetical protein
VANAFRRTLAHYHVNESVQFDRPFEEDMMEDIPSYKKVQKAKGVIRLQSHRLSRNGVHAEVFSSGKIYEVTLGVTSSAPQTGSFSCRCAILFIGYWTMPLGGPQMDLRTHTEVHELTAWSSPMPMDDMGGYGSHITRFQPLGRLPLLLVVARTVRDEQNLSPRM